MTPYGSMEDLTGATDVDVKTRAFRSFCLMAVCFSLNHACVTTVLSLASSELGTELAGYTSGTLYLCYTFSALFGATGVVHYLGNKQALASGAVAYCVYVLCFGVAALTGKRAGALDWAWALATFGAALGGVAAGWLWVAQAGYMTVCTAMYTGARPPHGGDYYGRGDGDGGGESEVQQRLLGEGERENEKARREAASLFASTFSTFYLGCEVSVKLMSFFMLRIPDYGSTVTLVAFSLLAVVSAAGMCFVDDHASFDSGRRSLGGAGCRGDFGAIKLFFSDVRMPLMYPTQMAFGFISSFIMLYVTDKVIKQYLGEASIGLLQGLIAGVAAVLSLPTAWAAKKMGTFPIVFLGLLAFLLVTLAFVLVNPQELGQWKVIVPLYVIYGYGRCVFESQNRAVMADFFSASGASWGANIVVASGGASTVGFFLFPHLTHVRMAEICLITTVVAMLGYTVAEGLHRSRPRRIV